MTPIFQEQVQRELHDQLQLTLGALARVEVVRDHPLLAEIEVKGLETGLDGWDRISSVKTHFVLVDFTQGMYVVKARQHDGMTGLSSPVTRETRTSDRTFVATIASRLVEQDFGLVGTASRSGKDVIVALKGGGLGVSLERWVKPGDVFLVSRITGARDAQRGTRLPWTLLEVTGLPRDGNCPCRLWHRYANDDLGDSPGVLGYRCLKISTTTGPVQLRIVNDGDFQPLPFLRVNILKPGGAKPAELTTNREGLVVSRDTYKNLAIVRIQSGDTVRAQFPVEITGAGTVVCRLKVQADAEVQTVLELRKEQWTRRILDNLRLASDRVTELNQDLNQSLDKALEAAQAGLKDMTGELEYLTQERQLISKQAEEKKVALDLRDGDTGLTALGKRKEDLARFVTRTRDILKESRGEKTLALAKMLERARLLEGEADFDQAIALYEKVLAASPEQSKVKDYLDRLKAEWLPRGPAHAQARAFLMETWPRLEATDLASNLNKAQKALAVCREAGDTLTPRKVLRMTVLHASHLEKQLDTLKRQESSDNIAQAKVIAGVIEGLRRLHAEATVAAGKTRKE